MELTKLTRKNQPYIWTEEHARAFQWVKDALTNASVLTHADFSKPFTLWTDARLDGVGAVLQQDDKPIAYESARFSPAERNYTIGEQELLAVIHALKKWRKHRNAVSHVTVQAATCHACLDTRDNYPFHPTAHASGRRVTPTSRLDTDTLSRHVTDV